MHAPGQVEQAYWLDTAQNVPNSGSVNPPEVGQNQLVLSTYAVGAVVQMVAASFHAMHAVVSPALNGNVPPSCVGAVMLYEVVTQPAIGDVQPWYSVKVAAEHVPGALYARRVVLVEQMLAGGVVQATVVPTQVPDESPEQWSPVVQATPSLQVTVVAAPLQAVVLVLVVQTWQTLAGLLAPLA